MNKLTSPQKTNFDCIVVGGGAIGLLTARQLFLEGVDVLLLEKGHLGGESSWAGGGIVSPLYPWHYDDAVNTLAQRSKKNYASLAAELLAETGQDCELITSGLFTVTKNQQIDSGQNILDWAKQWQVKAQYIDNKDKIQTIEPTISGEIKQGIWMPDIMQVRNPKFIDALKASFIKHQIPTLENTGVEEVVTKNQQVTGLKTKNKTYHASKIVIASGAWSSQFAITQPSVKVEPVKGQMIMYKGGANLIKRIILSAGHYIIPRQDGHILAGSTLEKMGFNKTVSNDAKEQLHHSAVALAPVLEKLPIVRHWAGLRPGTEKGIPYICQHHQIKGLYIHAGHFRNGIVLGVGSTELLVDIILERKPWCDISAYGITALH